MLVGGFFLGPLLQGHQGSAVFVVANYKISMSFISFVILELLGLLCLYICYWLFEKIFNSKTMLGNWLRSKSPRKSAKRLEQAQLSLLEGDYKQASKFFMKSGKASTNTALSFLLAARSLASTKTNDRAATFLYALGWTQHSYGTQIIRTAAMIQLILGNIGVMGGGINALRGHSNIQGLTDVGLLSNRLPAYLELPKDSQVSLQQYLDEKTPKPLGPNEVNFWGNYPKFFVSFMKAMYGDKSTIDNNWGFDWLPKWDKTYDVLRFSKMMRDGQANGFICQGFNPLAALPDKNSIREGLSKLKFLVNIDPMPTETAEFWKNHGESNDVDPSKIQTEVFRLPANCFAEENGTIVNSSRLLQWHWAAARPPYEALYDPEIIARIYLRIKELYEEEGGAYHQGFGYSAVLGQSKAT